jgi:serine/threonine protein kinase
VERCGGSLSDLFTTPGYDGESWLVPIARCVLQGIAYMHDAGYVHKDIHLRNVFWTYLRNELSPEHSPSVSFKIGDLGIARLAWDVDSYRPTVPWMHAPEAIDPDRFGSPGQITDIYNAGLVLLAVLLGIEPSYSQSEILAGLPCQTALHLRPPWGPAIAGALQPQTGERTQTAYELWEDISESHG